MLRAIALALSVLTGFSALVYEVAWQRYLTALLGSHSEATAAVLGLFLGGLAGGYALFGRLARRRMARAAGRPPRLLRLYGAVEIGIGIYALLFPLLFGLVQRLSFALPHPGGTGGVGFAIDVALCALLVGPPSVAMGATIPLLTQALARSLADATRLHALVYAANTAGAFAGALAAGFWLVPSLGLVGALGAVAFLNLGAGALFAALDRADAPAAPAAPPARAPVPGRAVYAGAALLVGFAAMTIQTVLIRLGGLALGASPFTFSMVVAVFVLCIAIGSLAVSALPRIPRGLLVADLWSIPIVFGLLYPRLGDAPYAAHVLRSLFANQPESFTAYQAAVFAGLLALIGPPVALSGASLPLLFDALRRAHGELGDTAGRLYAWNTVGSLLGALAGGYALLFWLDLHAVFRLALVALVLAAALVTRRALPASRLAAAAPLALALAAVALLPAWRPDRLGSGLFRRRAAGPDTFAGADALFAGLGRDVVFYADGPNSSVSVHAPADSPGHVEIRVNGKTDGAVPEDSVTMTLASLVPALLARKAETAFVVGFGTGVSAGVFAELDSARRVTVAEISRGVIEAAPFFDRFNHGARRHPKLEIVHSDAYRALLRSRGRFDVIVSEPSNPWVTGVEMLYSREFLAAARDRLTPGGVYAQWLQTYEIDPDAVALVLRTYASVFEHVAVWYAQGSDLLLLGLDDPRGALDVERIRRRLARPDFAAALRRVRIGNLAELAAHELLPVDVLHAAALSGPVHTLLHPRLSHVAARAFFAGGEGLLPVTAGPAPARLGRRRSLLRRAAARAGGFSDAVFESAASETCDYRPRECITLLAAWTRDHPDSEARERLIAYLRRSPLHARTTRLATLAPVSLLFGAPPPPDQTPYRVAEEASRRFALFYHHAVPFPRARLAELWRRCEREERQSARCAAGRARAEQRLGDLETPRAAARPVGARPERRG